MKVAQGRAGKEAWLEQDLDATYWGHLLAVQGEGYSLWPEKRQPLLAHALACPAPDCSHPEEIASATHRPRSHSPLPTSFSFIQEMFLEHLLCARQLYIQGYSSEQNNQSPPLKDLLF